MTVISTLENNHVVPESGTLDQLRPPVLKFSKKSIKKPFKVDVGIHDRTQCEVEIDYMLRKFNKSVNERERHLNCFVEIYLSLPKQLSINSTTYPKEKFYEDIRAFLRFRNPKQSYGGIIEEVNALDKHVSQWMHKINSGKVKLITPDEIKEELDHVKLISCSFVRTFWKRINRYSQQLKDIAEIEDVEQIKLKIEKININLFRFIAKSRAVVDSFRMLSDHTVAWHVCFQKLRENISLLEETTLYHYRDGMAQLLINIEMLEKKYPELIKKFFLFKNGIYKELEIEKNHSQQKNFFWITQESDAKEQENFLTRRNDLKRFFQKVLYLDIRTNPSLAFQKNFGAMVAAGLAGAWAVTVNIWMWNKASFQGFNNTDILGFNGLLFGAAFTLAYVLKDRIKELGRSYFSGGMILNLPDNSNHIRYKSNQDEVSIGSVYEWSKFKNLREVPYKIRDKLLQGGKIFWDANDVKEENTEVIVYRKRMKIKRSQLKKYYPIIPGIKDILRFNISSFLEKMDEPTHFANFVEPDGKIFKVGLPKIYPILMLVRFWTDHDEKTHDKESFCFKLIVNKNGLQRIESI